MSRFHQLTIVALAGCLLLSSVSVLPAQSDAETALQKAREAYQAERFQEAYEYARTASQTDQKNPDVWLLLGRAQYQLGKLDEALIAWRTLLKLAPDHDYARRMVTVLEGRATEVDKRIQLVAIAVEQGQTKSARSELISLRTQPLLTGQQFEEVLTLQAQVELLDGNGSGAMAVLNELSVRRPDAATAVSFRILKARAQLAIGGVLTNAGLSELREISAAEKDKAEGQVASLEILLYELQRGKNVIAEVAQWIQTNDVPSVTRRAQLELRDCVTRFLAASQRQSSPPEDSNLNESDAAALAAAAVVAKLFADPNDHLELAQTLAAHFEKKYLAAGDYAVAQKGIDRIRELGLAAEAGEVIADSQKRIREAQAQFELDGIRRDLDGGVVGPDVLAKWITEHSGHPSEIDARRALISGYLNVARRMTLPGESSELGEADLKAVAAAEELVPLLQATNEVSTLIHDLSNHFKVHYFERGARAAAIDGLNRLVPLEVPVHRGRLLVTILDLQRQLALADLKAAVAAGLIPAQSAPLPESLQVVADVADLISSKYPDQPVWAIRAEVANHILDIAASVPWPSKVTEPKAAHTWALSFAVRVISGQADAASLKNAQAAVDRVLADLAALDQPSAQGLGARMQELLLLEISPDSDRRVDALLKHVDLLMADAGRQFDENIRTGRGARNAKLSENQMKILEELSEAVRLRPSVATLSLQKLTAHLEKWSVAGYDAVLEQALEKFADGLPVTTQRRTRLALAQLWFHQVFQLHSRLRSNGFQVPRALDAQSERALAECYRLIGKLGAGDPLLADVWALRLQIIDHYLALDYAEIARAAISVKSEPVSADFDEEVELELAALTRQIAERQLDRQLQTHNGKDQIVLTPAFREAIAALKKFITDHPTSRRATTAADGIFVIGKRFEQHEAWLIAAGIYEDVEKFAAKVESLNQQVEGRATYSEKAAVARASAMHTRASRKLQEWNASKADDTLPPTELSDEFQSAQAAWHQVIRDYQNRPVSQTAIRRIMAMSQEYALLGAWDVADSIYEALLALELPLESPERLEFARAICQLGKVLPDHARAVLSALTLTGSSVGSTSGNSRPLHAQTLLSSIVAGVKLEADSASVLNPPGLSDSLPESGPAASVPTNESVADANAASESAARPVTEDEVSGLALDAAAPLGGIGGGYAAGELAEFSDRFRRESDARLFAAVRNQLDRQAQQVAMLRDKALWARTGGRDSGKATRNTAQSPDQGETPVAWLSTAELDRQQKVLDSVYEALQAIRQKYPESGTSNQARDEILVIMNHWREISEWDRAALLARRFLADNPTDRELPQIRQAAARDWLAWASVGVRELELDREALLAEISRRFETARNELQAILDAFPEETAMRHQAQWDIANSFLTQARVVAESSPTLARGQFVRATTELLRVAELFHDHPQIGQIPEMLWGISDELAGRNYHEEAISVWNRIQIHYPTHPLADQSALRIAQTWQRLGQPLRASEAFLELNFARGGNDVELQNTIYEIAVALKNEKRWIESLHVLQTFVDSFPANANAGQSLTMIGQIHQENEVWQDAIAAYRRVIDEFPSGAWTTEARWSIAECTINLSLWQDAMGAYKSFQELYPKDNRVAEAARRIEILKSLDRYQGVIDEPGQRKAFDAQFQVASIVRTQLTSPVKAIVEYRKVAANWPESHLADDALFEIGKIYLELGETELARSALLEAAGSYPQSPLADDALLMVGTSYVSEADRLAVVDRGKSQEIAKDIAQKQAYQLAQENLRRQVMRNADQISELKRQGKQDEAASKEAFFAGQALQFSAANTLNASNWAIQQEEVLSAAQLADRQDKINAALRKAVDSFRQASRVPAADTADDALLQMAEIYDQRLKDSAAAMSTWEEIVRQYSGTEVAEDASWNMARYLESEGEHARAIAAYQSFFRNYRRSERAGQAQASIAENYEHLGEWVQAMDAYTNYVNNFPDGPLLKKAREQINWIKTYRL